MTNQTAFFASFIGLGARAISKTGSKIILVRVAESSVTDVSQPNAKVPPKLLPQKIIKPAVKTREV